MTTRPNHKTSATAWWHVCGFVLIAAMFSGCNYLLFAGYLIGGPPSITPDFDAETGLSMTEKDIVVAVVCTAPKEVLLNFTRIDYTLSQYVANRMFQKEIQVINPDRIRAWLDKNADWDTPDQIGAAFGVDYVVYIELNDFNLYEKGSQVLHRGRSDVLVSVWEMEGEEGEQIFTRNIESIYPRAVPRSTYETKFSTFKRQYLEVLSEDIGILFYEHYHGEDMINAS